ncbi:hypothetical protein SP90_12685 [Halodesulfovibrio spirochaetisodalis]|uniref:Uncharacterized protein n=1 Tax=Halodesulfovibrio spirochaetisodalis TaxID=1560234 RepID=A0A1B7XAH8_9BACT|nr:hypothetical protein SP90_12685 [Halodesulfovibrio spirochaetisodalis]
MNEQFYFHDNVIINSNDKIKCFFFKSNFQYNCRGHKNKKCFLIKDKVCLSSLKTVKSAHI